MAHEAAAAEAKAAAMRDVNHAKALAPIASENLLIAQLGEEDRRTCVHMLRHLRTFENI